MQNNNVNFRDILKNINIEETDKILDSTTGYNILEMTEEYIYNIICK
jgi:hypothetical protein